MIIEIYKKQAYFYLNINNVPQFGNIKKIKLYKEIKHKGSQFIIQTINPFSTTPNNYYLLE